jgi:hypothetical protein
VTKATSSCHEIFGVAEIQRIEANTSLRCVHASHLPLCDHVGNKKCIQYFGEETSRDKTILEIQAWQDEGKVVLELN